MTGRAPSALRVERYAAEAASTYGISATDVMGTARTVAFVSARCVMWKRLYDEGFSKAAIGRAVGRHHTTVMHALRKM